MTQEDHQDLHRELEREADDLEHAGQDLDQKLQQTKADWESRQNSESVPGAEGTPGGLEAAAADDSGDDDEDA